MKNPLRFPLILAFCISLLPLAQAARVDTVDTFSSAMNKIIKAVVITPASYDGVKEFPVVYLLHGYSGSYRDWVRMAKNVEGYADKLNILIVCPDGGYGSWYWDSPADPAFKYETYVVAELIPWIDGHYKTVKDKKGRGITGLSMGGHGALFLAIRHQDVFGAAGSMSGGVDIRPSPNNWDMAKRLGPYAEFPDRWEQHTVMNQLHLLKPNSLAIMVDCGTEDFFLKVNERLHEELLYRNIPHDYIVRPGAHNWSYWTNAVSYQLLFMSHFFTKESPGR
ncbi:MAG: esterase family protein [Haliscomenobacter sp.]|nr:esterase family protein [Haliscomenobacter sp.]